MFRVDKGRWRSEAEVLTAADRSRRSGRAVLRWDPCETGPDQLRCGVSVIDAVMERWDKTPVCCLKHGLCPK